MDEAQEIDYKLLLNAIRNPVFIHDSEFNVIFANQSYCEASQKQLPEVLYHPYWESFLKRTAPLSGCLEALRTGQSVTEIVSAHDGKIYQSRSFPVKSQTVKQYMYSIHIFTDITEIDFKNKQIEDVNKQLNNTLINSIKAIGLAIEQRDPYTAGHQ